KKTATKKKAKKKTTKKTATKKKAGKKKTAKKAGRKKATKKKATKKKASKKKASKKKATRKNATRKKAPTSRGSFIRCHSSRVQAHKRSARESGHFFFRSEAVKQNEQKRQAAQAALAYIKDGITLGVGTGSTVDLFIDELPAHAHRLTCVVSSSERSTRR